MGSRSKNNNKTKLTVKSSVASDIQITSTKSMAEDLEKVQKKLQPVNIGKSGRHPLWIMFRSNTQSTLSFIDTQLIHTHTNSH